MAYELHITRAFVSYESERFPILGAEVDALVRRQPDLYVPPDAPRRPDFCYVYWSDNDHYLLFHDGRLSAKRPSPLFKRRMIELASDLDAWVIGDDAEVYELDGETVTDRNRARSPLRKHLITRGDGNPVIRADEWAVLVAAQPDFTTRSTIEAELPSGTRDIPCPPIDCWTGHPSGRPIPFFFNDDEVFNHNEEIEVRDADEPTVHRMTELAAALRAHVVKDHQLSWKTTSG
ncbi:hypothetical protein ACTI_84040 [Actinoplanes sp. OR16]|uniref:hypothetical protein n=1 Tax=Actinoplanes sp. OR16 TaxID=946334 RepID=UPI000F70D245|nr:hypothetical protein [Actinoplanes sp. OR16]BBH71719.1 hypothetical protein ACTI_84040 [Actinoplanes sp. OR16]